MAESTGSKRHRAKPWHYDEPRFLSSLKVPATGESASLTVSLHSHKVALMCRSTLTRLPKVLALLLPAMLSLAAACARSAPPVAVATLQVSRSRVPVGSSLEVTVRFHVAPTLEGLDRDYRVSLHVLDDDNRLLWAVDHDPPVPTSIWRPGQVIEYTQRVRIPPYPYAGPATVAISIDSPDSGGRLTLAGDDLGESVYGGAVLTIEPRSESSFIVYEEGWHQMEFDTFRRTEWRWSTDRAALSFRNPRGPARLSLEVQGRPDLFEYPQRLTIVAGERTIGELTLDTSATVYPEWELSAADLGSDDIVRLDLSVDQTFVPAERDDAAQDQRQLGVRVLGAYVEPLPVSSG